MNDPSQDHFPSLLTETFDSPVLSLLCFILFDNVVVRLMCAQCRIGKVQSLGL